MAIRYPERPVSQALADLRAQRAVSEAAQAEDRRMGDISALQRHRAALIRAGANELTLPNIHDRMSPADVAAAARRMGVTTPSATKDGVAPAKLDLPFQPKGGLSVDEARDVVSANQLRTNTPAPLNPVDDATVAAAGTGQVVQTKYGPVSSTVAPKGEMPRDTVTTDTGVQRLTPFQQVVKNHPKVGVAGSPENLAYVKAYTAAQAAGDQGEKDPVRLAENLFNPKPSRGTPAGIDPAAQPDIKAPTAIGAPTQPVPFAGADAGVADWKPPTSDAAAAGLATRKAVSGAVDTVLNPVKQGANSIAKFGQEAYGTAADFVNNAINPGAPATPRPVRLPFQVRDPAAEAAKIGQPVAPEVQPLPAMPSSLPFSSAPSTKLPMAGDVPGISGPTADPTNDFAENSEDAEFKKRLASPPRPFSS